MKKTAGWYYDGNNQMRWWDGEQWTGAVREINASRPKATKKKRSNAEQVCWVLFHWAGTTFAALAAFTLSAASAESVAIVAGFLASLAGSVMATLLARQRLASHDFIRGTITSRSVTGAWVLGVGAIVVASAATPGSHGGQTLGRMLDDANIIVTFLGVGTLLAVLGPGYSEYREARAKHHDDPAVAALPHLDSNGT